MKTRAFLLLLFLLLSHLSKAQIGSDTKTVRIDPNMPPNPPEKAGYKLVVWDEFDAAEVDSARWCLWGDILPGECEPRCFSTNAPSNVSSDGGVASLSITTATSGSCDFKSSEIKSFRYPPNGFRSWNVEPGSYLEIRVKMPHGANVGCAGWLYTLWREGNIYREIDIWETYHDDDTEYQINRHFGAPGAGEPFRVKVRDLQGDKVQLSEHFLTFGVHWEANNIGFYLNNKFVAEYCCFDPKRQFNWPLSLRLSAGIASLKSVCPESSELPKMMEVDYVRYYVRDTVNPLYLVKLTDSIEVDEQGRAVVCCPSIWVNYIPDVQYEAFSPAANFEVWPGVPGVQVWGISPLPDLPLETSYPITVVAHFPEPHPRSDTLNASFFVSDKPITSYLVPNRIVPQPLPQARVYPTLVRSGDVLRVENPFFYTRLQIIAVDGRILQEEILVSGDGSVVLPMGLSPGVYLVKLHADCALRTLKIMVH